MNSNDKFKLELPEVRGIELALLLVALFGFWEFTLSSWPFQSNEFSDLWPALQDNESLRSWLQNINLFSASNSRVLEMIPTLVAEACFVSYVVGRKRLFKALGLTALLIFALTLQLTNFTHGNHPYYDFMMLAVIVFAPGCLQSLRVAYALTYFMCSLLKINSGWITGGFFLTAHGYLPLASPQHVPYLTNLMIIFQMFGCFLLLSRNVKVRKLIASLFLLFHFYAIIIAGSRFSWSTFPFIVLLYMIPQNEDNLGHSWRLSVESIKQTSGEIIENIKTTRPPAAAIITIFLMLQTLSYFEIISDKRTFNMFSEATACVITVSGPSLNKVYGHPIGSNACYKEKIIRSAKDDFCSQFEDFDLRIEVSKNTSNYKLEHEQLSVCKNQVKGNHLPTLNSKAGFEVQSFISPARTSERVDVLMSQNGTYKFVPAPLSGISKEFWLSAKVGKVTPSSPETDENLAVRGYQTILLVIWLAISGWIAAISIKSIGK